MFLSLQALPRQITWRLAALRVLAVALLAQVRLSARLGPLARLQSSVRCPWLGSAALILSLGRLVVQAVRWLVRRAPP
jgi:hypothetical protein